MKEVAIRRKTITLPENMWKEISRFRLVASLGTDTEAVRQLLRMALDQKPSRAIETYTLDGPAGAPNGQ